MAKAIPYGMIVCSRLCGSYLCVGRSCVSCFAKDRIQDLNKAREFNSPWLPEKISGRRDGSMTNISPQNLVRGDIVRVREGQLVSGNPFCFLPKNIITPNRFQQTCEFLNAPRIARY
jgi:hypothetical protein